MFRCFKSAYGVLALAVIVALAIYLVVWHGQHVAAVLPFALVLLCPLSHMFMHRHGSEHQTDSRSETDGNQSSRRSSLE